MNLSNKKIIGILFLGIIFLAPQRAPEREEILPKQGWIEGQRGWDENGTNLWTAVSPLPNYNVGIGTSSPQYKLDVLGNSRIQGSLYINSWPISITSAPSTGQVLKWDGASFVPATDENSGGTISGSGSATQIAFWTGTNTIGGNNNLWWDNTNERLGIGTSTPKQKLDVNGQIKYGIIKNVSNEPIVPFFGLDGDIDKIYHIIIIGRLYTQNLIRSVRLGPNGNVVTTGFRNLSHRFWEVGGTGGSDIYIRNTGGITMGFSNWNADGDIFIEGMFYAETGRARIYQGTHSYYNVTVGDDRELRGDHIGWWNDSTTKITSLVIDFQGGTFTGTVILRAIPW